MIILQYTISRININILYNLNIIIITHNIGFCYFKLNQFKTAIIYLEKTVNSPSLTAGKTEFLLGASYLNTQNKKRLSKFKIGRIQKIYWRCPISSTIF